MSKEAFLLTLGGRLAEVNEKIRQVQHRLEHGELQDRVHAAGELTNLQHRREKVEHKIADVKAADEHRYEGFRGEIEEDLDAIGAALDRLLSAV